MKQERKDFLDFIAKAVNSSPYYRHIKMKVVDFKEGQSFFEMEAGKELTNLYGTLHGGAIASLLDSACGVALATLISTDEQTVTVDMQVNYFLLARPGKYTAQGKILFKGKSIGVCEGEIKDEKGHLIAKATTTHLIQKRKDNL